MTRRLVGLVLLFAGVSGCRGQAPPPVDKVTVDVRVLADGAADVHEALTVRVADSQTHFERHVALVQSDALTFVGATLDGKPIAPNAQGPVSVAVAEARSLDVRWTFPSASGQVRVFGLAYRATGVVAVVGQRGRVRLGVIPGDRAYPIGTARLSFQVPEAVYVFDGTGVAEAGWQVERLAHGIAATRQGIGATESATVVAELSVDPSSVAEPRWQIDEERTADLIPAFISGGLFVLVIGGGILWIVRLQYPRTRTAGDREDERRHVRAGLRISGWVALVAAVVFAAVTWFTLRQFGLWPMAVPGSLFIAGAVFVVIGDRYV